MAALFDLDLAAGIHHRQDVVVLERGLGKTSQYIQLGHRRGGALDAHDLVGDFRQQIGEKLMFQDEQTLIGAEDFIFQLFQFRRDVAFAGGQGLLAGEGIRHRVSVGAADLDVVAEHLIKADLQLGDAGLLAVFGFQIGKIAFAAVHDIPQLVDLAVVPGADGAAVL